MKNSDPGGAVPGQSVLRAFRGVRPGIFMRAVPISIPAFTPLNRPFPGCELDVPRLTAPRGPARPRAREPPESACADLSTIALGGNICPPCAQVVIEKSQQYCDLVSRSKFLSNRSE